MKTTLFPINIKELKKQAKEYADNGVSHLDNTYGFSINAYIEKELPLFYIQLNQHEKLIEYCLFYCFKANLYESSYKFESTERILAFQANELAYHDIFNEIKKDYENNYK